MKNLALPFALTAAAALALGVGVGGATKQPETVEVEKVVEVEKTPAACAQAFDAAEKVFASSARVIGYGQEAVKAAARLDAAGITSQRYLVDDETALIKSLTPKYQSAKASCLR